MDVDSYKVKSSIIIFRKSLFAGMCISLGGTVYLVVGGTVGAVLFSFGLLSVVHYELPLYTGKCGFIKIKEDIIRLPLILFGNIIGAFFFSLIIKCAKPELVRKATDIVTTRINYSILQTFFLAMLCGIIMTIVVKFAKKKKFIPLLVGIPLFIVCGFVHSIADSFYYFMSSTNIVVDNIITCLVLYFTSVIGNFVGCIIPNEFVYGSFVCENEE